MQNNEFNQPENFPSPPIKKDFIPSETLPVSPNNPPWSGWAAFGVWFASVAFIIILPNIFLLPYLSTQQLDLTDKTTLIEFAKNDPTAIFLQIISVIPSHIFTLLLCWLVVTRFRKFPFRETLGWKWNGFNLWNCLLILGLLCVLVALISYLIPEQDNDFLRILRSSRAVIFVVAFLATFTAPLVEEVVYRGILYSAFQRTFKTPTRVLLSNYRIFHKCKILLLKFNLYEFTKKLLLMIERLQSKFAILFAILFVTSAFALVHVPQYWGSPGTIFLICILSLVLTLLRWRTGNLLPCVFLHTVINGSQSLILIFQPYIENQSPQVASFIHFFK